MPQRFLTFEAICKLRTEELRDIAGLIVDEGQYIPSDKEVILRGIIMPFLRDVVGDKVGTKDQVLRTALVRTAESLGVKRKDWPSVPDVDIIDRLRSEWFIRYRQRLDALNDDQRQHLLEEARKANAARAREAGLAGTTASGIIAAEASGFGIYLATTSTIAAVGHAIGVVFPFALYQGATTALGVVLGPVGWVVAGSAVATTVALKWQAIRKEKTVRQQMVMIGLLLGLAPWLWYELPVTATRKEVDSVFRAIAKSTHPDRISEHVPEWMRAAMVEWFITNTEYKKRIIESMEGDAS